MTKLSPERQAETLSEELDLQIPIDLDAVLKHLNIDLQYRSFEDSVSGVLVTGSDANAIGVNANHAPVRQRFTIAHEIGHYLLHRAQKKLFIDENAVFFRKPPSTADQRQEHEANSFAASLLMPKTLVLKRVGNYIDVYDESVIRRLSREFGVSTHAFTIRLRDLGIG